MQVLLPSVLRAFLLTFAASFSSNEAAADSVQRFDVFVRIENPDADLHSSTLCGLKPLGINAQAQVWNISGLAGTVTVSGNSFCQNLSIGPYQSVTKGFAFSSAGINPVQDDEALSPYPLEKSTSGELGELSRSFEKYPMAQRAERIYEWMRRHIEFSGIRTAADGAEHALRFRRGDCTEHMLLAGELLQRNGFVVRRAMGFSIPKGQETISTTNVHNWIEYKSGSVWRIFDSAYGVFGEPESMRYVSVFYYQDEAQLGRLPFWVKPASLKIYL